MPRIWDQRQMVDDMVPMLVNLSAGEVYALMEVAGSYDRPAPDWDDFSLPVRRAQARSMLQNLLWEGLSDLHEYAMESGLLDEEGKVVPVEAPTAAPSVAVPLRPSLVNPDGPIFVVHGHDVTIEEQAKRLIERATGRDAVVLHEQPSRGRTIIEQIEQHSGASYAVVLLTGDDYGRAKDTAHERLRARQNVVLELGYFMAALGRDRVTTLMGAGVESPSDTAGIVYIAIDAGGAWRAKLLQEIAAAEIPVDWTRVRL